MIYTVCHCINDIHCINNKRRWCKYIHIKEYILFLWEMKYGGREMIQDSIKTGLETNERVSVCF